MSGTQPVVLLLHGAGSIRWHIHHQRHGAAIIKEVDRNTCAATTVRRRETAIEVREEIDLGAFVHARRQYSWHGNAHVRHRVVANDGGIDHESQESVLIGSGIFFQQRRGVEITDGHVCRTLSHGSADGSEDGEHF